MNTWNDWYDDQGNREHEDDISYEGDIEGIEAMARALLPNPWDDPHDIEYWVWDGERLVPATPDEQAAIQEMERSMATARRLEQWRQEHARSLRPQPARRLVNVCLVVWQDVRQAVLSVRYRWRHGAALTSAPVDNQQQGSIHLRHGER